MINHPNRNKKASNKPLPKICFALNPVDGSVVMIRYGEQGFYPQPHLTDFERREKNGLLGVSEEDERVMTLGSMFGWDSPAVRRHFHGA